MDCLKLMLFLSLVCEYSCTVPEDDISNKLSTFIEEYLDDDDYNYNYDDSKSDGVDGPPIANNDATLDPPYFNASKIQLKAKPGDDVTLTCDVKNYKLKNLVMWYKNKNLIVNGQIPLDKRIEVLKNNSIKINDVQPFDADDYYCTVLPENIRLHITLNVGKRLTILCDKNDVTDKSITFREGESHTFECKTDVLGYPIIKWSLNGQRAENVATKIDGEKMFIDIFNSEHSGIYQCLADDGSSDPPHGMVIINVLYTPKVSTHRHHVNTERKSKADMYCDYQADPIAVAEWKKNGQYLRNFSEKYSVKSTMYKGRNRTILTIKDIESSDLGEYECNVKNAIGSNELKVHLTYEPENPQFENMKVEGRTATLYWLVRSMQPLSEAIFDYKIDGSYTWSSESMIHTERHPEHTGIWKLRHRIELAPGFWHARVKTMNTVGWSKFSAQHDFKIEVEEEETEGYNPLTPGTVIVAGIGDIGTTESSGGKRLVAFSSYISGFFSDMMLTMFYVTLTNFMGLSY